MGLIKNCTDTPTEELNTMPVWTKYFKAFEVFNADLRGANISNLAHDRGCNVVGGLFCSDNTHFQSLAYLCPIACGCNYRSVSATCPVSCMKEEEEARRALLADEWRRTSRGPPAGSTMETSKPIHVSTTGSPERGLPAGSTMRS